MAGVTRRALLAALAAPLVLPDGASAAERDGAVLDYALLLEELQRTLYREALELDLGFDLAGLVRAFSRQEDEHVRRIRELRPGWPEAMRFSFALETRDELLRLAPTVEDTVVGAYVGAVPAARAPEVRTLLASILHAEAQQASTLRRLAGEAAAPLAFEEILSRPVLLDRVRPFIAT